MRRGDTSPHHQRRLQLNLRCRHARHWSADVLAPIITVIEKNPSHRNFLIGDIRHRCGNPQQSLLLLRAVQRAMGILVRPREFHGAHRRQSAVRLALLSKNIPDSKLDCLKEGALWQHTASNNTPLISATEKRQAAARWCGSKEELRSQRFKSRKWRDGRSRALGRRHDCGRDASV